MPLGSSVLVVIGLVGAAFDQLGVDLQSYPVFIESIQYRFYPLFALVDVICRGRLPPRDILRFHEFSKNPDKLDELVSPRQRDDKLRTSLLEEKMMA